MEGIIYKTYLYPAFLSFDSLCSSLQFFRDMDEQVYECTKVIQQELAFLEMFFQGLAYWEDLECGWHFHFSINAMMPKFLGFAHEFAADCNHVLNLNLGVNWEAVMYDFKKTIQQFKLQVKDICILLLGGAYKCVSRPSNPEWFFEYGRDTASFINLITMNLRTLESTRLMAPAMKQHISLIQRELEEFRMFVDPPNVLFDLISRTRAWINRISCLTYLYWIDGSNENLASAMETMLSGLLHETMPFCSFRPVSSYFRCTKIYQPLTGFLDLLLKDLAILQSEGIHEGVIFLFSFIMDPPMDNDWKVLKIIWVQSLAAMKKFPSLINSIRTGEMREEVCGVKLSDFLMEVDIIMDEVRNLCVVPPYSSEFCSPRTNVIGFLNSMIRNLKEMVEEEVEYIPSLRHQSELLRKELALLMRAVSNISELPIDDEDKEIQDLWTEMASTIYNADYFIKLCHTGDFYVWYGITGLSYFIQAIMYIKMKVNKLVGVDNLYSQRSSGLHDRMVRADALRPRGTTSEMEGVFMGFIKEKRLVIDELTRGQDSLTIISISGSGGQGKTTLAKQIYNDRNVQYHFHRSGWCYISKDRPIKDILFQIIGDVNKGDDRNIDVNEFGVQELVELLRKSLKGRRYFIVMDDIWDIDVWRNLELSFPDDNKGSRILFTSRNHDLASQAKSNSISYPLPLFSDEESWELIKKRVFGSNHSDADLQGIGKEIASYCKGLPLAVSLTAAVLGRSQQNLDSWNKVAENLKEHLAEEGCGNVLKLSYMYLPDNLKSCFLYFGAFQRGEGVSAKELKLLWLSEGFVIPNGEAKSTGKELATKCLQDLVSQGLVDVIERSSMGGIKRCNVHDLLYDLCLEICKEDNFLHRVERGISDTYRIWIGMSDPFIKSSPSTEMALPMSPISSLTWVRIDFPIQNIGRFKLITVLNLKKCRLQADQFLKVSSLIYLRYLAIHFRDSIEVIPPGIAKLSRLEALIVDWEKDLPTLLPVLNMKSLRHVHIKHARLNMDDIELEEPSNIFGGAFNLEALGSVFLDVDDSRTIEFIRKFPNLRKLRCKLIRKDDHQIMKLLSVVGSLLPHMESLGVAGVEGVLYPTKIQNPKQNPVVRSLPKNENLIKLSLFATYIRFWSVISQIGKKLPNLRVLKLRLHSCVGKIWELQDGDFSKLTYLEISGRGDFKEIDVSSCDELPLPCLEHLVLYDCRELKDIPSIFGEHCSLKRIKVSHCQRRVEDSAMSILEQQREFGNESFQVMVDNTYDYR